MVPKIVRGTTLGGDHFSYERPFPFPPSASFRDGLASYGFETSTVL